MQPRGLSAHVLVDRDTDELDLRRMIEANASAKSDHLVDRERAYLACQKTSIDHI